MPDLSEQERLVLTKAYATPDATPEEIATAVDVDEETVESVLSDHDEVAVVDAAAGETDWENPYACPFCGAALSGGGQGFMDHVEASEECELAFERWRENVGGDIGAEWMG